MGNLIAAVMIAILLAIGMEIVCGTDRTWIAFLSLAAAAGAVGLAALRTVRNAAHLGQATDPPMVQTTLARTIYRHHLCCLAAMVL
ncbi:MAG: hypothetical protein WDN04_12740 [Rhodospirillales bacterium]